MSVLRHFSTNPAPVGLSFSGLFSLSLFRRKATYLERNRGVFQFRKSPLPLIHLGSVTNLWIMIQLLNPSMLFPIRKNVRVFLTSHRRGTRGRAHLWYPVVTLGFTQDQALCGPAQARVRKL